MAVEHVTTSIDDEQNSGSDLVRKIVAAIVGLIVIIAIVLLAKWAGDLIRARFIDNKKPPVVQTPTKPTTNPNPTPNTNNQPGFDPKTGTYKISTISAIPATGPNDTLYILLAVMGLGGATILTLSKKFSVK